MQAGWRMELWGGGGGGVRARLLTRSFAAVSFELVTL